MEGSSNPPTAHALATRIQKLGGDLAYMAMDEQLWFGHFAGGPQASHFSIDNIAHQVAIHVAEVRAIFPNVHVGDIEPLADPLPPDALDANLDAYKAASGTPFAFLHGDVQWAQPWQMSLISAAKIVHAEGMQFGVIIDSDHPPDTSDTHWTSYARQRMSDVLRLVSPDDLIFQSWVKAPSRWLPDSQDGTLTSLVKNAP
jgi:hypothetical protein